jgi:hypothetical protein
MKLLFVPVLALLTALLSSCYYQPAPGYGAPGYGGSGYRPPYNPGYNPPYQQNNIDDGKIAHNQGFNLGVRDARRGLDPKYFRYANLYNKSTQKDFGRGYMTGYRTVRPR